jgi:uncharacterized membrane protein
MTNLDILKQANSKLEGKRLIATVVAVIIILLTGVPQNINPKYSLLTLILGGPIGVGTAIFFLNLIRGYEVSIEQLFDGFRQFIPSLLLTIFTLVVVLLGFVCFIIPGVMLALGLSFGTYVMADNPELSAIDVMRKTWEMMDGHKLKFFLFSLLCGGLFILGFLFFIIGIFYILPIVYTGLALFYEKIRTGTIDSFEHENE